MIAEPLPMSQLHTFSRTPMHRTISKLSDSVKLLIELDEKWELHRFDIAATAEPVPSIQFLKPLEAREITSAVWEHGVRSDGRHDFSALCDGVVCWFLAPEATGGNLSDDDRSEMNTELLQKVAEHIRAHPEEFSMNDWDCGTTACIAGHAARIHEAETGKLKRPKGPHTFAGIVGISRAESGRLFYACNWPEPFLSLYKNAETPQQCANIASDRIEAFIRENS